jgi:hypothetical protein
MENESFGQKVKRTTTTFMKRVLIIALVLFAGLLAFWQWGVYEEGVKAGKVLSVSEKGFIFKTHEGKLNLETFGALKGASPIAESFDFSVEKGNDEVIKDLQEVALSGERVNLYFIKRYVRFPWRGDTNVFVEKVERLK